ncbi:MaoC family dehydratase [Roseibium denhamense]|uniref:Acyl dehydratase n=1 Tax=Roseibium denhamense TaxID=76305 RepID=A0ABY1NG86_9HYPH|nr:MaoC family dehydratase [Roseibium denhamense]MTI06325.1 MaoC family dehydratase [Roseibium denhamense]SMP08269.1 Acyl dehydratase [Roseibium denhamense]
MASDLHFEDFVPGQTYDLGSVCVSKDEIVAFAAEYDPQPFHLDEEAGRASMLGGLAASGWHTCAMVMRLLADGLLNRSSSKGAPGVDTIEWKRPVFPGDTLSATATIQKVRSLVTKPDLGLVFVRIAVTNQDDLPVLFWENPIMFAKREMAP